MDSIEGVVEYRDNDGEPRWKYQAGLDRDGRERMKSLAERVKILREIVNTGTAASPPTAEELVKCGLKAYEWIITCIAQGYEVVAIEQVAAVDDKGFPLERHHTPDIQDLLY